MGSFRVNDTVLGAWNRTLECARALGCRFILFQCPARFAPTRENKDNLKAFFREIARASRGSQVDEGFRYVWEPRGAWKAEEVRELCEELDLVRGVDPFQQGPVTEGPGYFRLHGRTGYRYHYSDEDLHQLLGLARDRAPCYVLFNNIAMAEDAERFQRLAVT